MTVFIFIKITEAISHPATVMVVADNIFLPKTDMFAVYRASSSTIARDIDRTEVCINSWILHSIWKRSSDNDP